MRRADPMIRDPMEHRFGREAPFALGVEEELLLARPGERDARARVEPDRAARPTRRRAR